MLGDLTTDERRVLQSALRDKLASVQGAEMYLKHRGLKPDSFFDKESAIIKSLLAQLG